MERFPGGGAGIKAPDFLGRMKSACEGGREGWMEGGRDGWRDGGRGGGEEEIVEMNVKVARLPVGTSFLPSLLPSLPSPPPSLPSYL